MTEALPRNFRAYHLTLSLIGLLLLPPVPSANAAEPIGALIKPSFAEAANVRPVTVGLDKSVQIDLPADVREISISNPAVLDAVVRTARRVNLLGQKIGQATASFIGQDGRPILTLDISVERDLGPVNAMIRRLMPKADVRLEAMNDNIVLSGSVASPLDATRVADIAGRFVAKREQVLNMLNVETKEQVQLKVNMVEMNRSVIRRLGFDIREALASGNVTAVKIAESAFPLTAGAAPAVAFGTVAGTLAGGGSGNVAGLGWGNGKARIDALLQALERNGLARVLAEPNLTSVSGETAKFLAGGEYPVPVGGGDKSSTSIVFKPFGVGLSFTPVVLSAGRISLQIETEVSELTNDGAVTVADISVPALRVRRASSTLELPSGGSLVMAGLNSSQTRRNVDGLPGLRNLPVLGALFRSDEFVRSETELVVIVTPVLVTAAAQGALSVPEGDGLGEKPSVDSLTDPGGEAFQGYGYIVE